MTYSIGFDVGGTKIAAALYGEDDALIDEIVLPTPMAYTELLSVCEDMVLRLENGRVAQGGSTVGMGLPGAIDHLNGSAVVANLPFMNGLPLRADISKRLGRDVRLANDANCLALAEAIDGAGKGAHTVLGLILGTGVGGGFVVGGKILDGPNGLAGEFGHLPLPFREPEDGPVVSCTCKQSGCIDKSASGPALTRLYQFVTGHETTVPALAEAARAGDADALRVLDRFYDVVAKAVIVPIHAYDPDVIVVAGGLNNLPGLYDEVPKRWEKYSLVGRLRTKFVPAVHGPKAGLRGAAFLWKQA